MQNQRSQPSIEDIGCQRETLNRRLQDIEKRYRTQFSNLDVLLGNMSRTSSYLTQQLAAPQQARRTPVLGNRLMEPKYLVST